MTSNLETEKLEHSFSLSDRRELATTHEAGPQSQRPFHDFETHFWVEIHDVETAVSEQNFIHTLVRFGYLILRHYFCVLSYI